MTTSTDAPDRRTEEPEPTARNSADASGEREDSDQRDVDEQFRALLEGLRTSLPGVQVLFGFLLVAPFQRDFGEYDTATVASFTIAFFASAVASVLLIAPSVHQRVRAPASGLRRRSKRHLIIATWVTIVGTVTMGVAIAATVFLVATFVFADMWVAVATSALAAVLAWAWFYLPLVTFQR